MLPSKNRFEVIGDDIHIYREKWPRIAFATYREDYYAELSGVTWTNSNGYLTNGKLGALHRYIVKKWYGEQMLEEMTHKGWVVDHMNNDGFDCRISNLEFLSSYRNVAKGQTLDREVEQSRMHLAVTLCKDFSTGYYQVHIGCNDPISLVNTETGEINDLAKLKLLYACDYRIVIADAEQILLNYNLYKRVNVSSLQCIDWKAEFFEKFILKEEEKGCAIIERGGRQYFQIGNGVWFHSSPVETGWKPSEH